ncbi:MAG: hypothetical protein KDD36_08620 [Flavobacteriales bacterium]|nr:hypothetical protein [Flavobacteriales bacterium]
MNKAWMIFLLSIPLLCHAQEDDKALLLQRTLNMPFIQKTLDEEGQVVEKATVILQNDLVSKGTTLSENGQPVAILTKEELREKKITRYREYVSIRIDGNKAMIRFIPHGGGVKGSLWFEKAGDTWLVKKIRITQNYRTYIWKEGKKNQKLRKTKSAN